MGGCLEGWGVGGCGYGVSEGVVVDACDAFVVQEGECSGAAVAVLGEYQLSAIFSVVFAAADEHDHVGVLLDGSGLAQVGELGTPHSAFGGSCLDGAVELRKEYDGYVQLFGDDLCHA